MNNNLFFKLPAKDGPAMAAILEAACLSHANWEFLSFRLVASEQLIRRGEAIQNIGYEMDREPHKRPFPQLVHRNRSGEERVPNHSKVVEVISGQKLPGFVEMHFDPKHSTPMAVWIRLASNLVRQGYIGKMHLHDQRNKEARVHCLFQFQPWKGTLFGNPTHAGELGEQPARLRLIWNEEIDHEHSVLPVFDALEKFGLTRYEPEMISA